MRKHHVIAVIAVLPIGPGVNQFFFPPKAAEALPYAGNGAFFGRLSGRPLSFDIRRAPNISTICSAIDSCVVSPPAAAFFCSASKSSHHVCEVSRRFASCVHGDHKMSDTVTPDTVRAVKDEGTLDELSKRIAFTTDRVAVERNQQLIDHFIQAKWRETALSD
jgi:hypothetical protein